MLLFATYLFEEEDFGKKEKNKYQDYIKIFLKGLNKFKKIENESEI